MCALIRSYVFERQRIILIHQCAERVHDCDPGGFCAVGNEIECNFG